MEEYLAMGVKPLIEAFPGVEEILDRYDIACGPCTIGTCELRDVIKVHVLSPQDESDMMAQIAHVIYPDRDIPLPALRTATDPVRTPRISYSPPVQRLVDEHKWIKRLLALIPDMVDEMLARHEIDSDLLRATVDFIRGYADQFHHMKEEDILFDYTDREMGIVQVILADHDRARGLVRAAVEAVENGDVGALCTNLIHYRELLTEHITKEDAVLYPYIDSGLTTSQVGKIWERFEQAESALADDIPQRYMQFIVDLEGRFYPGGANP